MEFYRRRLPHLAEAGRAIFLTWRLHDSLPPNRAFPSEALSSGQAFAAMDRLLDEGRSGPLYLRQPAVADMLAEAIEYNAMVLEHYTLHAFVVMPNHVAEINQVAKRHYRKTGQYDVGPYRKTVLAGGKL